MNSSPEIKSTIPVCTPDGIEAEAERWWRRFERLQHSLSPRYATLNAYQAGACRHGAALAGSTERGALPDFPPPPPPPKVAFETSAQRAKLAAGKMCAVRRDLNQESVAAVVDALSRVCAIVGDALPCSHSKLDAEAQAWWEEQQALGRPARETPEAASLYAYCEGARRHAIEMDPRRMDELELAIEKPRGSNQRPKEETRAIVRALCEAGLIVGYGTACAPEILEEEARVWWDRHREEQNKLTHASLHAYKVGACRLGAIPISDIMLRPRNGAALTEQEALPDFPPPPPPPPTPALPDFPPPPPPPKKVTLYGPNGDVEAAEGSLLEWDSIAGIGVPGTGAIVGLLLHAEPAYPPVSVACIWVDQNERLREIASQLRDLFAPASAPTWGNRWPGDGLSGEGGFIWLTGQNFSHAVQSGQVRVLPERCDLEEYRTRFRERQRGIPPPPPLRLTEVTFGARDYLENQLQRPLSPEEIESLSTDYWRHLAVAFAVAAGAEPREAAAGQNCSACGGEVEEGEDLYRTAVPSSALPVIPWELCAGCACNWALGQVLKERLAEQPEISEASGQ